MAQADFYRQIIDKAEQEIEELKQQRLELYVSLSSVEKKIRQREDLVESARIVLGKEDQDAEPMWRDGKPKTMGQAAFQAIVKEGRPLKVSEVLAKINKQGFAPNSPNPEHALRSLLHGMVSKGDLIKVGKGTFGVPRRDE